MAVEDDDTLATFLDVEEFGEVFLLPGGARVDGIWNASEDVDLEVRGMFLEATFRDIDVAMLPTRTMITRAKTSKQYRIVDRRPDGLNGMMTFRLEGDP